MAQRFGLLCVLLMFSGCVHHTKPPIPTGQCSNVIQNPGVEPSPCSQVQALFAASRQCYSDHVDQRASAISLDSISVIRVAANGVTASGEPWIYAPDGTEVYGYYDPSLDFIAYNFTPTLLHEFHHKFAQTLHPETAAGIGHGGDNDPLKGVNCRTYYTGEWK